MGIAPDLVSDTISSVKPRKFSKCNDMKKNKYTNKPCVSTMLKFLHNDKEIESKALIDTGNTTSHGVCISETFYNKLGLKLQPGVRPRPVTTAKSGSSLTILGVTEPVRIKVSGLDRTYEITPLVIRHLNMSVNIGARFMHRNQLTVEFTDRGALLKDTNGNSTGLVAGISNTARADRTAEVFAGLKLDEKPLLQSSPKHLEAAKKMVSEYIDIFASEEEPYGRTYREDTGKVVIEVKPGARAYRSRPRPMDVNTKKALRKQLDLWLREGIIRPSKSPWAAPVCPVMKKDGDIRFTIDYRELNKVTVADSWPIPRVSDQLERLAGKQVFSSLDAAAAYHNLEMSEESKKYTAFTTPFGLFEFNFLPFGLTNAVSAYSRFIWDCFQDVDSDCSQAYLDDILTATEDLDSHMVELRKVFDLHRNNGIKVNAKKTNLFLSETRYLGHLVSSEGIRMIPEYIARIVNWPRPKTVKELSTWLGFTGYYRQYITNYAWLTQEMNSFRKKSTLDWDDELETKFKLMKEAFAKDPIRAYPRFDTEEPFQLTTDFSAGNVAAILSQVQDGKERLIGAVGRKTTKFERNYGSTKGELCALVFGCRKFTHLLRGRKFIVNTDSKALTLLQKIKPTVGILTRWMEELQGYQFEVRHRPGKANVNADALSRSNHLPEPSAEEVAEEEQYICAQGPQVPLLDRPRLLEAQRRDHVLQQVRQWMMEGRIPALNEVRGLPEELHQYRSILKSLRMEPDGLLIYPYVLNTPGGNRARALVPEVAKSEVWKWVHSHRTAGHFGSVATLERARRYFYFPGMTEWVRQKLAECGSCLSKKQKTNTHDTEHEPRRTSYPLERLAVDLVGPLPETREGYKYVLTMEDSFSRFVQVAPLKNKEAVTVANALMEQFICRFGCPAQIISDNGREFANEVWEQLLKELRIRKSHTPAYNPQSNVVERFHRTLNQYLRVFLD